MKAACKECEVRPSKSRGLCNTCYERWRLSGHDGVSLRRHRPPGMSDEQLLEYIFDNVEKRESGCWVWTRSVTSQGRPNISWRGRISLVSRVVLFLTKGPPPEGMECCHSRECEDVKCVNPDHLRWDTHLANEIDKREVGGRWFKLCREDVRKIRHLSEGGTSQEEIGDLFGVSAHYVRKILRGEIWAEEATSNALLTSG